MCFNGARLNLITYLTKLQVLTLVLFLAERSGNRYTQIVPPADGLTTCSLLEWLQQSLKQGTHRFSSEQLGSLNPKLQLWCGLLLGRQAEGGGIRAALSPPVAGRCPLLRLFCKLMLQTVTEPGSAVLAGCRETSLLHAGHCHVQGKPGYWQPASCFPRHRGFFTGSETACAWLSSALSDCWGLLLSPLFPLAEERRSAW